jgi:hypothetical protein
MPEVWYYKEIRNRDKKIRELGKENERLQKELENEKRKREQAEQELKNIAQRKASKKPRFSDYSMRTQEKKMKSSPPKKSTGRRTTAEKIKEAQKCWAHFLRTAIRLMLDCPQSKEFKTFFHALYAIFAEAKKAQQNETLAEAERAEIVSVLQSRIVALCTRAGEKIPKKTAKEQREFLNLQKRLLRNIDDLFTFVLIPQVEATNNRAERGFRKTAKARNNYQTSKTKKGADRRSVIASVLTSLQQNLSSYTLQSVTEEVVRWRTDGISLFQRQLQELRLHASP